MSVMIEEPTEPAEPAPTNFNDLPLDIMGNIVEASRKITFWEMEWPVMTDGLKTTWRQALPKSMVSELESPENSADGWDVKDKWGLKIADEQICEHTPYYRTDGREWFDNQEAFEQTDAYKPCFMVWLIHDIPKRKDLDDKVMDTLRSHYVVAGGTRQIWYPAPQRFVVSLYWSARQALGGLITKFPEGWLSYAKNLVKNKKPKTLVDVYDNLFNNDDPVMKMQYRSDRDSVGL